MPKNNFFKKIKIPFNVNIFFHQNNIITFANLLTIKSIKLKTKVLISKNKTFLIITKILLKNNIFNKKNFALLLQKNFLLALQKTYSTLIKNVFNELIIKSITKLKLVGIGFRARILKIASYKILYLQLGFSHKIYIRIPLEIQITCFKFVKILLFSYSQEKINKLSFLIRSCKFPEIYKGKGILYEREKIKTKKGKRV